jgi:hypothetical protein
MAHRRLHNRESGEYLVIVEDQARGAIIGWTETRAFLRSAYWRPEPSTRTGRLAASSYLTTTWWARS